MKDIFGLQLWRNDQHETMVDVRVYDLTGRQISVLANGAYSAGSHMLKWDASGFATGMYIYQITARGENNRSFTQTKKMMLIK